MIPTNATCDSANRSPSRQSSPDSRNLINQSIRQLERFHSRRLSISASEATDKACGKIGARIYEAFKDKDEYGECALFGEPIGVLSAVERAWFEMYVTRRPSLLSTFGWRLQ